MTAQTPIDETKLMDFVGKAVRDMAAAMSVALVTIGDKLGLYRAMAEAGPLTPAELAERTGTSERYVHEWLLAQAAAGYARYDAASGRFSLSPEQAVALTDENSPACVLGGFQLIGANTRIAPKLMERFRTGAGFGWEEHEPDLFQGVERFFRPGYAANLVSSWIPALEGVEAKLKTGARVADIGCGHGASTIIMAQAYPNSRFAGFDYHAPSIGAARRAAAEAGVDDRVRFEVAAAKEYPGRDYDLVCCFDCLHDMGDPVGAARHVRESLTPDGTWLLVEPFTNERPEENFNPLGQLFYAASTLCCTPASLAQEVGLALGNQATDAQLREVVTAGGFTRFRRATETPVNRIFEVRP